MEEVTTKAKQYSRSKTRLTVVQLVMTLLFLLIILFCGASLALKELVEGWSRNYYVQLGLYLFLFGAIYEVLFIWLEFYGGFLLEHKYLLSNQTFLGWVKKNAKKAMLSFLIFLPAMEALYFFLRNFPKSWWLLTTGGWLLLSVVLGRIMPTVIIPLFHKCKPMTNTDLKERLINLGRSSGVMIKDVFEIKFSKDTKKANAAIAGFGKGRRVLLGDTLLEDCSDEEIEAVFAHELGHIRLLHTWKIFGFGAVISLVSFYFTFVLFEAGTSVLAFEEAHDIGAFPLLALVLMVVGLILMPMQLWYSRHLEKRADIFAVQHVENPQSFASVMAKLASQNLIDMSPSRLEEVLLHDHPSISKRLSYINSEAKPER
ncbi:MAG: M48 family metallopeptidase [Planctomycetota bacterium]|jgi:STE24 endopeptidase